MKEIIPTQKFFAELTFYLHICFIEYARFLGDGAANIDGARYSSFFLSQKLKKLVKPSSSQTKENTLRELRDDFELYKDRINDGLVVAREFDSKEEPVIARKQAEVMAQFQILNEFLTRQLSPELKART